MNDIYIARLPCGCVIDVQEVFEDETDAVWLYHASGNGWIITRQCADETIVDECKDMIQMRPLTTKRMF